MVSDDLLLARLDRIEAKVDALAVLVQRAVTSPRDRDDLAALRAIIASFAGQRFEAIDVRKRAKFNSDLEGALDCASVDTTIAMGRLLGRVEGLSMEGVSIRRAGERNGTTIWEAVAGDVGDYLLPVDRAAELDHDD